MEEIDERKTRKFYLIGTYGTESREYYYFSSSGSLRDRSLIIGF